MSYFISLSTQHRTLLTSAVFISVCFLFALVLYQCITRSKLYKTVLNTFLFAFMLAFLAYVMSLLDSPYIYEKSIRWLWVPIISVVVSVYSIVFQLLEYKKNVNRLSPTSVKEAFDDLEAGICFSNDYGRIILINSSMNDLSYKLLGRYPQMISELQKALETVPAKSGVEKPDDALYKFDDGKVWRFCSYGLTGELSGFTQITAQDVTEVFNANAQLRESNAQLHQTISEILKQYDRLSDRVREQETLAIKIKVHNEIGQSLLAIAQMIQTGDVSDVDEKIKDLQYAVWHLTPLSDCVSDSLEAVRKQALSMGITLVTEGTLPNDEQNRSIALLAITNCVTNCYKHANGKTVFVNVQNIEEKFIITVTNDGIAPDKPIKEGGGLSSLRRTVENVGGSMKIDFAPRFVLTVILQGEEKNV